MFCVRLACYDQVFQIVDASFGKEIHIKRDIRATSLYREVEAWFRTIHAPGEGSVTDAAEVCVAPDGKQAAFTGTVFHDLASTPVTGVYVIDLQSGVCERFAAGERGSDRLSQWSPDGSRIAFLSDRHNPGDFQLYVAAVDRRGEPRAAPAVEGCVEQLRWSPDGRNMLLGVAGYGADMAGCQGGAKIPGGETELPEWMPHIDTGDATNLWRTVHVHDLQSGSTRKASRNGLNYWEAAWCGNAALTAIVSDSHGEGSWYTSRLIAHEIDSGPVRTLYEPGDQIGALAVSPSGNRIALIEAVCSDRLIVCGTLKIVDASSGCARTIPTDEVEVTCVVWRDDRTLLVAGHRGPETVVADIDPDGGPLTVHWSGAERTFGNWYPAVSPVAAGGAAGIGESYDVAPEFAVLRDGNYEAILSFATAASAASGFSTARVESVTWTARDGLQIQGWLIRPPGDGPFPLVMDIHGGPVWHCRNRWAGRLRGAKVLADHGIASLYPNPRGSSGRGQDFARLVKGDMGGEDTYDYLAGCDALAERGIADPHRLGVTGISYGGFASSWLITQDHRFAAAVPISPTCNWYSQHRTSQIPFFDELFLNGSAYEPGGLFFDRSPVMFAANVRTPTLLLTGLLDQNTPPTQALEFHRSLLEHKVKSVLATYPGAGHGIRTFPEIIDATTRYVGWFLEYFDRAMDK